MPRDSDRWHDEPDDDWDDGDDWDDDGDWDETDESDDDEDDTVPCPYCRKPIHEDAERCPHCEQYISAEDAPPAGKPWWLILGVAASLLVVYFWIMAGR